MERLIKQEVFLYAMNVVNGALTWLMHGGSDEDTPEKKILNTLNHLCDNGRATVNMFIAQSTTSWRRLIPVKIMI